jgi:hypothetical protein
MREEANACRVFVGNLEGRSLGRHRHRWESDMEVGLDMCTPVNMVINFQDL